MSKHDRYIPRSSHRDLKPFWYYFVTNNTSAPTSITDRGGKVLSVVRSSGGQFTITLNDTYAHVNAMAQCQGDVANVAHVESTTGNTIVVGVRNSSLALADTSARTIAVRVEPHS